MQDDNLWALSNRAQLSKLGILGERRNELARVLDDYDQLQTEYTEVRHLYQVAEQADTTSAETLYRQAEERVRDLNETGRDVLDALVATLRKEA